MRFECSDCRFDSFQQLGLFLRCGDRQSDLAFGKADIRENPVVSFMKVDEIPALQMKHCRPYFTQRCISSQHCEQRRDAIKSRVFRAGFRSARHTSSTENARKMLKIPQGGFASRGSSTGPRRNQAHIEPSRGMYYGVRQGACWHSLTGAMPARN